MTTYKTPYVWDDELTQVRLELGDDEIARRVDDLTDYHANDAVVTVHGGYEVTLTPAQALALAELALTLGDDLIIIGGSIKRRKPLEQRIWQVCENERARREREATAALKA
jgi:hypothetical protein